MGRRPQKRREMLRGAVIKKKMTVSLPFLRNPPHPTTAGWVRAPGIGRVYRGRPQAGKLDYDSFSLDPYSGGV
jgi:hypothetical protein